MGKDLSELEQIISMQESYFENLIKLGLLLENSGQHQKVFDVYRKGIKKAEKANTDLSYTMLGLLD
jgi:predicted transcriptional regulator